MKNVMTIDTGTTNTRVSLWQDEQLLDVTAEQVGVRNTAVSGSKCELSDAIGHCIREILSKHLGLDETNTLVIGSGMLTSDVGLVEIPHLTAPAGLRELAAGMTQRILPEVCSMPIWFIPGVKNNVAHLTAGTIGKMDVMRGEETETIAALKLVNITGPALLLLPGSHTKIIKLNQDQQIEASSTSMTGEILSLLTKQSLLSDSLDGDFTDQIDSKCLVLGYQASIDQGLGSAAFNVRLLHQFTELTQGQRANYLLGVVLAADLQAIQGSPSLNVQPEEPILILGKPMLREALRILIEISGTFNNPVIDDNFENLAGIGAIQIARMRGLLD